MTDQPAHDEAEVERRCLHEVGLLHVLASAEPRSSMAAGLAEMSEGAFEELAASSLQALALARLEAGAVRVDGAVAALWFWTLLLRDSRRARFG
jgi:hypothetical protein